MQSFKKIVIGATVLGATQVLADDHPIVKVIATVKDLGVKAKEEGEKEAVTYENYEHWCGKTKGKLEEAIKKSAGRIEELDAVAKTKKQEKKILEREIAVLTKELGEITTAATEMAKQRADTKEAYDAADKDLKDTIDAVDQAVKGLTDSKKVDLAQLSSAAASLIQMPLALENLSQDDQIMLAQLSDSPLSGQDPKARTYDFKSDKIINMLKNMKIEFVDKKNKLKQEEMTSVNEYTQAKGASDAQKQATTESKKKKEGILGEVEELLTATNTDLASATGDRDADTTNLKDTTTSCTVKADEFKQRVYMREQEQEAIAFAIKILQKVSGVRSEVPSFIQTNTVKNRHLVNGNDRKAEALLALRSVATQFNSRDIRQLSDQVEAHLADPKVSKSIDITIEKQIWALKDEQLAEDKKKQWCDAEISKTDANIKKKTSDLKKLTDDTTVANARVKTLTEEIKQAETDIQTLKDEAHEALTVRTQEKNENKLCIEDAQDAQEAIKNAVETLNKYYKDAADAAASFIQESEESTEESESEYEILAPLDTGKAPDSWDKASYTGADSSNVVKALQETQADFAKVEADTNAKEESELAQFNKDMTDNKKDLARKTTAAELKGQEVTRLSEKLAEWSKSSKMVDREKALLEAYAKDVDKECNGKPTYDDRKKARKEEMDALDAAKKKIADAFKAGNFLTPVKPAVQH
eukprot:TRINITY_DN4987_c0_g2_i1.p1 TRINITY_DN4987_c0_g2~~TRINITY_DN4987_c0_g2_i1.p1  ORF type:complete len:700 (+),score=243.32 TRINITY_DN4987_c0_g2_i1:87-2186(+)